MDKKYNSENINMDKWNELVDAEIEHGSVECGERDTADFIKKKVPWLDLNNNELFEGDTIRHPDGETGIIIFCGKCTGVHDQWRVDYGDGVPSRLSLQIGDKGQAVKFLDV